MPELPETELVAALRRLGPQGRLPGAALYSVAALAQAGLDPAAVAEWAAAHGGGAMEAGAVKLRKGQRPEQGRVGRPEAFVRVPEALLR